MAATVTVSDFESLSRLKVNSRAIVLAEGICRRLSASAVSARRRRVARSVTTRGTTASHRYESLRPMRVEPLKMRFERTPPGAEDIRAPTAQHVANETTAVFGAAHDLLYRDPRPLPL